MFTEADSAFLDRLDSRTQACLSRADQAETRLLHALEGLRELVGTSSVAATDPGARVDDLLDAVWCASTAHDRDLARTHARDLAHAVRDLSLDAMGTWRAVAAALEIRSLVVLAA
jgi:hypothetical protein